MAVSVNLASLGLILARIYKVVYKLFDIMKAFVLVWLCVSAMIEDWMLRKYAYMGILNISMLGL